MKELSKEVQIKNNKSGLEKAFEKVTALGYNQAIEDIIETGQKVDNLVMITIEELKHKVGDKVRIIAQNEKDPHGFFIGEEVEVIRFNTLDRFHDYQAESTKNGTWWIDESAISPIETRKIKGYSLKEECKQYRQSAFMITDFVEVFSDMSASYDRLKEAGVLDLWFEPVYEEPEFTAKKGEWVVITDLGDALEDETFTKGVAYQLRENLSDTEFKAVRDNLGSVTNGYSGKCVKTMKFRYATPSEISKAKEGETKIITMRSDFGNFEIEVSKRGIYYRSEKAWLSIPHLIEAIKPIDVKNGLSIPGYYTFKPTMIDAGCKKGTYVSDWEKVIEEYEKICKS